MEDLSTVAPKLKAEIVEKNVQGLLEAANKNKDQPLVKPVKPAGKKSKKWIIENKSDLDYLIIPLLSSCWIEHLDSKVLNFYWV